MVNKKLNKKQLEVSVENGEISVHFLRCKYTEKIQSAH